MNKRETVSISISHELYNRLVRRAEGIKKNIDSIVCAATGEYLDCLDGHDYMVAENFKRNNS